MIKSITIGNYKSFREPQTFDFGLSKHDLAVVYGQNAGGKSNFFKALLYMKEAVSNRDPLSQRNPLLEPFLLNTKSRREPSYFEIILEDSSGPGAEYRYGFQVGPPDSPKLPPVVAEWLFETKVRTARKTERKVFVREGRVIEPNRTLFSKSLTRFIKDDRVPSSILAVNRLAEENHPQSVAVTKLIKDLVLVDTLALVMGQAWEESARIYTDKTPALEKAQSMLKDLDFGVNKLVFKRLDKPPVDTEDAANHSLRSKEQRDGLKRLAQSSKEAGRLGRDFFVVQANTTHNVYDESGRVVSHEPFMLERDESMGTYKLITFLAFALETIEKGRTMIVDEFGSSWHTLISRQILRFLNGQPGPAQFVLISHDTNLLGPENNLDRNQVWILDKNRMEETTMINLSQFPDLRPETRLQKRYLEGHLGGVPAIKDISTK